MAKNGEHSHEFGDNAMVEIIGRERETFDMAMELVSRYQFYKDEPTFQAYTIDKKKGFVLLSSTSDADASKFPCPLNTRLVSKIVWHWLTTIETCDKTLYGSLIKDSDIDFDGSTDLGFKICTKEIGIDRAIVAIKPWLIWFGK